MANRRSARQVVRTVRRPMFWLGATIDLSLASGVSAAAAVITEASFEAVPNPTVIRIRGHVSLKATAVGAADARSHIEMGIMVVDAKAFAAGIGSLELPGTDIGSDWMWWDVRTLIAQSATPVEDTALGLNKEVIIDNKAMRKVGLNQLLVFVAENTGLNSAITIQTTVTVRVLVKK